MPTHTSVLPPPDDDGDAADDGDGAGDPVGWLPGLAGEDDAGEDAGSPAEVVPAPVGDAGLAVPELLDRLGEAELLGAREPGPASRLPGDRFGDTSAPGR
jgi:hypothetical protein